MPSICHLTILNPTIHTRIFYKLALSQIKYGYDVSIYGQDEGSLPYEKDQVRIYPMSKFSRLSLTRLFSPWKLLFLSLRNRADIYTIHTPELLWVGWLLKKLLGCKLIYDVHEDYEKNIRHGGYYTFWLRKALVFLLRLNHHLFIPSFDAISYAELCYDNILGIPEEKIFILRNTFSSRAAQGTPSVILPKKPYLLFSGTIAAQWGIWESLELWKKIREEREIGFVLAGFTFDIALLDEIKSWVDLNGLQEDFLLVGGNSYLAYTNILFLLTDCYASLGLYRLESYIKGKIPTKFYEAMAYHKPIIFTKDQFWEELNQKWNFGISYDQQTSCKELLSMIDNYYSKDIQHSQELYSWDKDEQELQRMLHQVLAHKL